MKRTIRLMKSSMHQCVELPNIYENNIYIKKKLNYGKNIPKEFVYKKNK